MATPIKREMLLRYLDGEDLPPDLEARISEELRSNPELRMVARQLSLPEEEGSPDAEVMRIVTSLNQTLQGSRLARVQFTNSLRPDEGCRIEGLLTHGGSPSSDVLTLSKQGGRLRLTGEVFHRILPISLMVCDYDFAGPESLRSDTQAYSCIVRWAPAPQPISDPVSPAHFESQAILSLAASSEEDEPFDRAVEVVDGRLILHHFPARDPNTHEEVLIAELSYQAADGSSRSVSHPFVARRYEDYGYLHGRLDELPQPDDALTDHAQVVVRPMNSDDWPLLTPDQVSLTLTSAFPEPLPLIPIDNGFELNESDTLTWLQVGHGNATRLMRYTVRKGGE